jgi:hypothetical protein
LQRHRRVKIQLKEEKLGVTFPAKSPLVSRHGAGVRILVHKHPPNRRLRDKRKGTNMISELNKTPRFAFLTLAIIVAFCAAGVPAFAKDITVTRSTDRGTPTSRGCTFREAIATANTGTQVGGCTIQNPQDTGFVNIHLSGVTYTFDPTLDDLNINSPDFVTFMGSQTGTRLTTKVQAIQINIGSQAEVVFQYMSLIGSPVFIAGGGYLAVSHCEAQRTPRQGFTGKGGAFLVADGFDGGPQGGELSIAYSWIHDNGMLGVVSGGAIYVGTRALASVYSSTISNNQAAKGGALYVVGYASVWNSTISGNSASTFGGGVAIDEAGSYLEIRDSTIMDNKVTSVAAAGTDPSQVDGGGLYVAGLTGPVTLYGTLIARNSSANGSGNDCRSTIRFDDNLLQYVNSIQSNGGNFIGEVGGNSSTDPCPIDAFNDGSMFDNFGFSGNPQLPNVCSFGSIHSPAPVSAPAYLPMLNGNLIDQVYQEPNFDLDQLGRTRSVLALPPTATEEDIGAVERQPNDPVCQ